MNLKCLQLAPWMRPILHTEIGVRNYENTLRMYSPQDPVLNRPGRYLQGGWAWFELEDGRAFSYTTQSMERDLELLEAGRLTEPQIVALQEVVRQKLATKKQGAMLKRCEELARIREIHQQTQLFLLRCKKRSLRENPNV